MCLCSTFYYTQTSCSPRENLRVRMESKPTVLRKTPMTSRFKSPNCRVNVENWVTKTTLTTINIIGVNSRSVPLISWTHYSKTILFFLKFIPPHVCFLCVTVFSLSRVSRAGGGGQGRYTGQEKELQSFSIKTVEKFQHMSSGCCYYHWQCKCLFSSKRVLFPLCFRGMSVCVLQINMPSSYILGWAWTVLSGTCANTIILDE